MTNSKDIADEIQFMNEENLNVLHNLKKFNELLDSTEITINKKIIKLNEDMLEMMKSLDENITSFRTICENTLQ